MNVEPLTNWYQFGFEFEEAASMCDREFHRKLRVYLNKLIEDEHLLNFKLFTEMQWI